MGLVGSAFLNCLGMEEEGERGQSFSFCARAPNSPSQVSRSMDKQMAPVAKPSQSHFQNASHSR